MTETRAGDPRVALVFAGGDRPPARLDERLPRDALVIGADSGIEHAQSFGRRVEIAVGDFDSVDPDALARAEQAGARVERHPRDKDATDLELALDLATREGLTGATIVGGHGGRLDHFAANLLLLGAPRFAELDLDAWFGIAHVTVVRGTAHVGGPPGSTVSLLALGGRADGVTTTGLRYPLRDAPLLPGSTLGVSNELDGPTAEVSLRSGVLLVIQPDALDDERGPR
jgi:thiamine pyrophosphokinase